MTGKAGRPAPRTAYADVDAWITKDGSRIRELMHPDQHGNRKQSLAEASLAAGQSTRLHRHLRSEELYHFTAGFGRMWLGDETFEVRTGDTVCIPPGVPHRVENLGPGEMKILCSCAPAYSHADTELL